MFDNIRKFSNLSVIAVFGISFIFFVLVLIINMFQPKSNVTIDTSEINKYISEDKSQISSETMVKDYNTFLSLQSATENFIDALSKEKYGETYTIMTKNITDVYSLKVYTGKIKEYYKNNFEVIVYDMLFENSNNLVRAYEVSAGNYICETLNSSSKPIYIGVTLNMYSNTYEIFYLDI